MNSENFNIPQQPTKAPHAGGSEVPEGVREVPTREFDTPLAQAYAQDLINEVPSTVNLTPEELAMIEERRKKQAQGNGFMNFLKKPVGKATAAIAGLALAASAGAGIASNVGADKHPTSTETVATGVATPGQTEKSQDVPAEAKDFVASYGNIFTDPVSTYYAQEASRPYINGIPVVLSPDDVANYEFTDTVDRPSSPYGFAPAYMLPETQITTETTADLYNKFLIPWCITPYLNNIARNPSTKAMAVLDNEFMKHCGSINSFKSGSEREAHRASTQRLLDTLKPTIVQYGTTAVFKVADATNQQNSTEKTVLKQQFIESVDLKDNTKVLEFSDDINLVIDVDSYRGNKVTRSQIVANIDGLSVNRTFTPGGVDPGRVAIGQTKTNQ